MLGEGYEPEDGNTGWSDWHWFKVRGNRLLRLIILSEKPVHYKGHYISERMQPCAGPDCKLCAENTGSQLRYVFAVVEVGERRPGLLEVGRTIALQIQDWEDRNGGLRGMEIHLTKESSARKSRMVVDYVESCEGPWWRSSKTADVRAALLATWEKAGYVVGMGHKIPQRSKSDDEAHSTDSRRRGVWTPPEPSVR